jgi:hypothetical protein
MNIRFIWGLSWNVFDLKDSMRMLIKYGYAWLIRLLLALAEHQSYAVHHMDAKSAFFNGDLVKEVDVM